MKLSICPLKQIGITKQYFAACTPGYYGLQCNISCSPGYFGELCAGSCQPMCSEKNATMSMDV